MSNEPSKRVRLSIENAPNPQKMVEKNLHKKLGLINKDNSKMRSFRLRVETIDALEDLRKKVNKKSNIKISMTQILELLIIDANKNPAKVLEIIND